MTSSNFMGCSIGSLGGRGPLAGSYALRARRAATGPATRPIGHKATGLGKGLEPGDHRQPVLRGKRHDPPVVRQGERVCEGDERV